MSDTHLNNGQSNWKNMTRDTRNSVIAGVCSGIARYFDWNPKVVRIVTVLSTIFFFGPLSLLIYVILWYVMDPSDHASNSNRKYSSAQTVYGGPTAPQTSSELKDRFARLDARLAGLEECVTSKEFDLRQEFRKLGA